MTRCIKRVTAFILNIRKEQARNAEQIELLKASPLLHWNVCRDDKHKKVDGQWERSGFILPSTKPSTVGIRI